MKTSFLRPCLLAVALCGASGAIVPAAHAAPKDTGTRLEIWPAQRTLVILPLRVDDNFLADSANSGDSKALATALVPVVSPELSTQLQATGKFSITRPYKFDPLLRRGVLEGRVTDDDLTAFVTTPGLTNAQAILSQLGFDQPGMVAQVSVERLLVGGTTEMPTVQLTVRGDLYQGTETQPFRSITVTSKPAGGKTPEERLRAAAQEAFGDVANAFVAPPETFQLPAPPAIAPVPATPSVTTPADTPPAKGVPAPGGTVPAPGAPLPVTPTSPDLK